MQSPTDFHTAGAPAPHSAANPDFHVGNGGGAALSMKRDIGAIKEGDMRLASSLLLLLLLATTGLGRAQGGPGPVLNEILVDPNGSQEYDTDGSGAAAAADEYLELFNEGGVPLDLSTWELWDAGSGRWFIFPPGTIVAPGGYAAVIAGVQAGGALPAVAPGSMIFDAGRGSGVFNNSLDNVVLYDPAGDRFWQLVYNGDAIDDPPAAYDGFSATAQRVGAAADFGATREGVARTRAPDGGAGIVDHDTIAAENGSPGRSPAAPSVVRLAGFERRQHSAGALAGAALLLTLLTAFWWRPFRKWPAPGEHSAWRLARPE